MGWAGTTYFGVNQWLETEYNWNFAVSSFDRQNIMEFHYEDLIC
jgi:hypothetical protein